MTILSKFALLFALLPATLGAITTYDVVDYATPQDAVDAAEAAGGGLVQFPCSATTVLNATLVINSPAVVLAGCGPSSIIAATFASGNIIQIGNTASPYVYCGDVKDLRIVSTVTRTSGYAIAIAGCQSGTTSNIEIATSGGNGIRFGDGASLAALYHLSQTHIFLTGAFTGLQIDGSNDRYVQGLWIQGNDDNGSRGIVITETGGDWISDVEVVKVGIGVSVVPPAGKSADWANFNNVLADTNRSHGFLFGGQGALWGISCVRCWSASNGYFANDPTASGIKITNGRGLSFSETRVINNAGHGFEIVAPAQDIEINGGLISENCIVAACTAGSRHGVYVSGGVSGFRIFGARSGGVFGGTSKQGYGISIASVSASNFSVSGNDLRGNTTGSILNAAGTSASKIVKDNI